jgi:hypothetical protein
VTTGGSAFAVTHAQYSSILERKAHLRGGWDMFWLIDLFVDGDWGQLLFIVALVVGIIVLLLD